MIDRFALKSAVRAAVVTTATFGAVLAATDSHSTALFTAFGCLGLLIFAQFSGPPRARLTAYTALAVVGAGLIALGTLCSRDPVLASVAMGVVGFAILFSGIVNGYFAAAGVAAVLTFVLPVMVPAGAPEIPDRLLGWGVAAVASIASLMLIWPGRPRDALRADAALACRRLAELMQAGGAGAGEQTHAATQAVDAMRRQFVGTPYRPTGSSGATGALAALVEELGAILSIAIAPVGQAALTGRQLPQSGPPARAAIVAALRDAAARVERRGDPAYDLDQLERAREGLLAEVLERVLAPGAPQGPALVELITASFGLRALTRASGRAAQLAATAGGVVSDPGLVGPAGWGHLARREEAAAAAAWRLVLEHLTPRSVCFRNAVRGAVGLAAAVLVAQLADLQHSFWVVLGMLSVLRSNALGTGSTILSALGGAVIGMVVGGVIVLAAGSDQVVLWASFPVAVGFAAYAPRAISFLAGQAAFTVAIIVLFDLIDPKGWEVGLVRVEDVAIGAGISLGVGLLFWPRGAAGVIRTSLAGAYSAGADYAGAAFRFLFQPAAGAPSPALAAAATASSERLDSAVRQGLAERSADPLPLDDLARLVAGPARLRGASEAVMQAARRNEGLPEPVPSGQLVDDAAELRDWYRGFGESLVEGDTPPDPASQERVGIAAMAEAVSEAARSGDADRTTVAITRAWGACHLAELVRAEGRVVEAVRRVTQPSA